MNEPLSSVAFERLVRHYRVALEQIAALSGVTEVRGPLEDIGVPDHMVKEDGWVPIHPRLKAGLCHAAKIAKDALDSNRLINSTIQPHMIRSAPQVETKELAAFLKPFAQGVKMFDKELAMKLERAAFWLEKLSGNVCGSGYIGCEGGPKCPFDHK